MKRGIALIFLPVFSSLSIASDNVRWSYEGASGPSRWGKLSGHYKACETGRQQSPINIAATRKEPLPPIEFHYKPSTPRVLNDGHVVQVNVEPGGVMRIGKDSWSLVEYHAHTPGEEQIQGKSYDMGMHFVHRSESGQLAVVAVLYKLGRENAALQPLWKDLPKIPAPERALQGVTLNPADLLPANKGYYTYEGSLSSPPCSEGVRWFVLKEPVEVSKGQVLRLWSIFHNNARPVQPLNGRVVKESL